MVANKEIKAEIFMEKLENYIKNKTKKAIEKRPYINPPKMFKDVPMVKN